MWLFAAASAPCLFYIAAYSLGCCPLLSFSVDFTPPVLTNPGHLPFPTRASPHAPVSLSVPPHAPTAAPAAVAAAALSASFRVLARPLVLAPVAPLPPVAPPPSAPLVVPSPPPRPPSHDATRGLSRGTGDAQDASCPPRALATSASYRCSWYMNPAFGHTCERASRMRASAWRTLIPSHPTR
mmetsp:Transcript_3321/g.11931  ORF Transcript_3321/g.11931 Transcript_3321/m.11931 type:complete len:183 (-) Transcript_3321:466-1014(-)